MAGGLRAAAILTASAAFWERPPAQLCSPRRVTFRLRALRSALPKAEPGPALPFPSASGGFPGARSAQDSGGRCSASRMRAEHRAALRQPNARRRFGRSCGGAPAAPGPRSGAGVWSPAAPEPQPCHRCAAAASWRALRVLPRPPGRAGAEGSSADGDQRGFPLLSRLHQAGCRGCRGCCGAARAPARLLLHPLLLGLRLSPAVLGFDLGLGGSGDPPGAAVLRGALREVGEGRRGVTERAGVIN